MKQLFCFLLALIILLPLFGCSVNTTQNFTAPFAFYYCTKSLSYDTPSGVVAYEMREGSGYENDPAALLELYLQGPVSTQLTSPFPTNVKITHYLATEDRVQIVLSKEFSSLQGIDLTLAATCLAQTIFEMIDTDTVHIAFETESKKRQSIIITAGNYLFSDMTQST